MRSELLASVFSDETELFRSPSEPDPFESVRIRIRAEKGAVINAVLLFLNPEVAIYMHKDREDEYFDYFSAEMVCLRKKVSYLFVLNTAEGRVIFQKTGASEMGESLPESVYPFSFTPGFHVPEWSKGALQYQIFTDRFCNGDASNDVQDNEYYYVSGHSRHAASWDEPVGDEDIYTFYGGDLQGVRSKLDYLQSLGVEVLYFNPLFISPSTHKYDVQDYDHIDPHFGVIKDDIDHSMLSWEKHNGYAPRYIRRVTSPFNLYASDSYFASFCEELHRRGMKIILDGVFNHCGSFNKWMDREGIYFGKPGFEPGAYQSESSPYRPFFAFRGKGSGRSAEYEGWWGYPTLPKLNYENSDMLKETIFSIAEKWASPPYSIDGWRLDVAADLGHSEEFNHAFWREFRQRVKAINPELLIIAEHYGDASPWLSGDEWDTVMNYDAFMEPLTYFFTGMEKHSDGCSEELYQNGSAFFTSMQEKMARMQAPSLNCAMNELSNHDHSRFLTRTNRCVGRLESLGAEKAGEGVSKAVFREAVTVQMTWPGAPTIYYGDEAGLTGWTDPDSRRTYPWGHEDTELIEFHRTLAGIRKHHKAFTSGSLKPLLAENGVIAYARFNTEEVCVICCNNTDEEKTVQLAVRNASAKEGSSFTRDFETNQYGYSAEAAEAGRVEDGILTLSLKAKSAGIYCAEI